MAKLWDKGYTLDKIIEEFTVGKDYILDQKLVKYDAIASIAHAEMLEKIGVLTNDELRQLKAALEEIIVASEERKFKISPQDEDCHTAIENYLVKKVGDAGKKIHTARSRNDQVLGATRLYVMNELGELEHLISGLVAEMKKFDKRHGEIKLPGYSHMRTAMPSTVGLWIGAFKEALQDDLKLIKATEKLFDQSPLGSAAGYGVPVLDVDRDFVAKKLGFKKVQKNTLYVQNSRGKFELNVLQTLQQPMLDLNRLAVDIMLFSTEEFGYLGLPDQFLTGSSIMPQKKNFDVIELLRGKTAIFGSYCHQIEMAITNLPSGYNRDYQLTKQPLIEGIELVKSCIPIAALVVQNLKVNKEKCEAAVANSPDIFSAERAYELVQKGMPFRDAYRKVSDELNNLKK